MSGAFAQAAATLAANTDLGEAVIHIAADGTRTPCRAIRYQRDPLADLGQHHVRQSGWVFSIRIAEIPAPARGDKLEMGLGREPWGVMPWDGTREIFDVQMDEDMLTHRVSVR